MESYYYSQLQKPQQNAYYAIKTGLLAMASSFLVPRLSHEELAEVYAKVRLDCPEIFYAIGFKYRYFEDSGNVELIPEYLFDKNKIKSHQKALKSRVEKLIRPAKEQKDVDKLLYIHDFICRNVRYDKLKKPYSHEIIGPLGQGVGVCEGIAKTVKILCDELGIWCIIAISHANKEKGVKYRHAWNIVRINGIYYHLDATFDQTLGCAEMIRYDYFRLSDQQIFQDHEALVWQVPVCEDGGSFYYKEKKLSFTKLEDVRKRSLQAVKKGKELIFHWRGGFLTREVIEEMLRIFVEEARKRDKHPRVSLNRRQGVVHVSFVTIIPEEYLVEEEINEVEREN